jgi:formylglycine-generating enzyme required for sulfatase activity
MNKIIIFILLIVIILNNCTQPGFQGNDIKNNVEVSNKIPSPKFTVSPGNYSNTFYLDIYCEKSDVIFYYTKDGRIPDEKSIQGNRIFVDQSMTIKVIAKYPGMNDSDVVVALYNIGKTIENLEFYPVPYYYTKPTYITVSTKTSDVKIYYTLDGTTPDINSNYINNGESIYISNTSTLKAIAKKDTYYDSNLRSGDYIITGKLKNPGVSVSSGTYNNYQIVNFLYDSNQPVKYYYTIDGSNPRVNGICADKVVIDHSCVIKLYAKLDYWEDSNIAEFSYNISGKVSLVKVNPNPGAYSAGQTIVLSTITEGTTIYYTNDGTDPSINSIKYNAPFTISQNVTIKAIAVKSGWQSSDICTFIYEFKQKLTVPTINYDSGTYNNSIDIIISHSITDPGFRFYYTIDGSDPADPNNPNRIFGQSVNINKYCIFKACVEKEGFISSDIVQKEYTFICSMPVADIDEGTYSNSQEVKLSSATAQSDIYYTIDGTDPITNGIKYYGNSIVIDKSLQLKAVTKKNGWINSPEMKRNFIIIGSLPDVDFSPSEGSYKTSQLLTLSCKIPDVKIYYSFDNDTNIINNGNLYSSPILLNKEVVVYAIAVKTGWNNSNIVGKRYVITGKLSSPVFSVTNTTNYNDFDVVFTTNQNAVNFYYTTDNTDPRYSSTRKGGNSLIVNTSMTLKLYCEKQYWDSSDVSTITYDMKTSIPIADQEPESVFFFPGDSINLSSNTNNSRIYYTTDGSIPFISPSTKMGTKITFTNIGDIPVKAIAAKEGYVIGDVFDKVYRVNTEVKKPESSLTSGVYYESKSIVLGTLTEGANIYYTINSSLDATSDPGLPQNSSSTRILYGNPINLQNGKHIIRAQTEKNGVWSRFNNFNYEISGRIPTPVIKENGVEIVNFQHAGDLTVTIETPGVSNALIYYTLDGTYPSESSNLYSGAITIQKPLIDGREESKIITVFAKKEKWVDSYYKRIVVTLRGNIEQVQFSPDSFNLIGKQQISFWHNKPNVDIYYTILKTSMNSTLIPTDPSNLSTKYQQIFEIGNLEEARYAIKVICYKDGWLPSSIKTLEYKIYQKCKTPYFISPDEGIYKNEKEVLLSCDTTGAIIYWKKSIGLDDWKIADDNKIILNNYFSNIITIKAIKSGYTYESDSASRSYTINLPDQTEQINFINSTNNIIMNNAYTLGVNSIGDYTYQNYDEIYRTITSSFGVVMSLTEITNSQFIEIMNWGLVNNKIQVLNNKVVLKGNNVDTHELFDLVNSDSIQFINNNFKVNTGKEKFPVVKVSWYGAAVFCNLLSEKLGYTGFYNYSSLLNIVKDRIIMEDGYRLPTEVESEIAAKGSYLDTKYTKGITNDPITVYDINITGSLMKVDQYNGQNGLLDHRILGYGFSDILGNAREWVSDWYIADCSSLILDPICIDNTSGKKVIKGGGFLDLPQSIRCSRRDKANPDGVFDDVSFRIVRKKYNL